LTARRLFVPAPTTFSASSRSTPRAWFRCRTRSTITLGMAVSPESAAHIASASGHAGSLLVTSWCWVSGHSPAGSAVANATCAATAYILGVKRSTSTAWTSIRAASASPMRKSSQARSAIQSAGLTPAGVSSRETSARLSMIEAQREAIGASTRRISTERYRPCAVPNAPAP
jgi:hypothetical protein